jgi:hypothetical protein
MIFPSFVCNFHFSLIVLLFSPGNLMTSLNTKVPPKTKVAPSQWIKVNGLLNQKMEIIKERNLRRVTTERMVY